MSQQVSKKQITIMLSSGRSIVLTDEISDIAYKGIISEIDNVVNNESVDNQKSLHFETKSDDVFVSHEDVAFIGLKLKQQHNANQFKHEIVLHLNNGKTIIFSNGDVDSDVQKYQRIIEMNMSTHNAPRFTILPSEYETLFINNKSLCAGVIRERNINHKG